MRMTLRDYAAQYVRRVDGSAGYGDQFRFLVNALEKMLGRSPVFVDELTTDVINQLVQAWKAASCSTVTVRSRRNMMFRIAQVASRDNKLDVKPPQPVRDDLDRIKRRYQAPDAWVIEQIAHLVQVASRRFGCFRVGKTPIAGVELPYGAPWVAKSAYWESYIRAAWDCGLRPCDLTRLRRSDVQPNGKFSIVTQKTGRVVTRRFRPATLAAIERTYRLSPKRELIWPVWSSRGSWYRTRKRLLARAGLKGGMNKLRHSAGTAVEVMQPGSGHTFLGNSIEVFTRHYFDQRHSDNIPQPPELPESNKPVDDENLDG